MTPHPRRRTAGRALLACALAGTAGLLAPAAAAAPVPADPDGFVVRAADLSGPVRSAGVEQVLRADVLRADVDRLSVAGRAEVTLDVTGSSGSEGLEVRLARVGGPVVASSQVTVSGLGPVPQEVVVGLDGLDVDLLAGQALEVVVRTADSSGPDVDVVVEVTLPLDPPRVVQLPGANRVDTAVRVSDRAFASAGTVLVARADRYPDALAAAPLAGVLDAPVLLSFPGGLDPLVAQEVRRLRATRAVLLGGEAALSSQVEADLRAAGVTEVDRVSGPNRYATAAAVADTVRNGGEPVEVGDDLPDAGEVFVVRGRNPLDPNRGWEDAVALSALAAFLQTPVLLTEQDLLPPETRLALERLDPSDVTVVGGNAAVSQDLFPDIADAAGIEPLRLSGPNRYATSEVLFNRSDQEGLDVSRVWLATGRSFPDGLTAGPAAASLGHPLLLVDGRGLGGSPDSADVLRANGPSVVTAVAVGGDGVITPAARAEVADLLDAWRG